MRRFYFIFIATPFLFSSCLVLHRGDVSGNSLPNQNVSYVDIARGNSKSVFVFGLGNLKNEGLVAKAKYDMYRNRPLKENEFYSNFTTSITDKYIFLFAHITRLNVSADVLKPKAENFEDAFTENFKNIIWQVSDKDKLQNHTAVQMSNGQTLHIGDTVYYAPDKEKQHYNLYTISSLSKETALLIATSMSYKNLLLIPEENKNTLVSLTNDLLFLKHGSMGEFKHGDHVLAEIFDKFSSSFVSTKGVILGFANNHILIQTKNSVVVAQAIKVIKAP